MCQCRLLTQLHGTQLIKTIHIDTIFYTKISKNMCVNTDNRHADVKANKMIADRLI